MGLLANSTTFVRYSVEGDLTENFWTFAAEQIAAHSFRDIDDSYEEISIGWVSVLNMFDAEFSYASYAAGDYIVLTLRVDERKVSPQALKKFCLKEEERLKKERQIPKLNRSQKLEIKDNVKLMLTKKAVPVPATYDLCWNLGDNTLFFFSTSQKAQEILEDFFKETFGLNLARQIPYLIAEQLLDPAEHSALADIRPALFV